MNAPAAAQEAATPTLRRRRRLWLLLVALGLVVIALLGLAWWLLYARYYESTDDAYVSGDLVNVMSQDAVTAELKFTAANDIGPRWCMHLLNVEFIPSKALNLIADTWGQIEVTGEATAINGTFGTMTLVTAAPTNETPPSIVGTPTVGTVLAVDEGAWTGAPDFTYQWSNGGTPPTAIAGATGPTYTPVAGDTGKTLICTVTGSNGFGSLAVPSAPSATVS